jgi:predicted metal-binding membrane protein
VIGAAILLFAGLFQFSSLKYRCLEGCRSPLGFVLSRWDERSPRLDSFRIRLSHGAYCVGCCWLLMPLMFLVGGGSIGPWGKRLAAPLGIALIIAAGGVAAHRLGGW